MIWKKLQDIIYVLVEIKMRKCLFNIKNLDIQTKRNIFIFLSFVAVCLTSVFLKISSIKSNASKNVVTLQHLYEEHGVPVFANKIMYGEIDFFSTISIESIGSLFVANIDRSIPHKVYPGALVLLQIDKNNFIRGHISSISDHMNLDSGGYEAIVKFNSSIKLRNSFESALVSVNRKMTIAVDNDNIGSDKNGNFVWIVKNNLLHKQYIKIGLEDGFKSEILSGLRVGDVIVTSDLKSLKEGTRARVVDTIK